MATESVKVITGKVRASYAYVFEARPNKSGKLKYSSSFIIPKSDKKTVAAIEAAIKKAQESGKTSLWGGKIPPALKTPLRDGDIDKADDPAYADSYFVNANSDNKPGIVDKKKNPITDEEEFYSGCFCIASLSFYPYNADGSKGVGCGLNNILKVEDGERFSGRASASDDFEDYFDEDSDPLLG